MTIDTTPLVWDRLSDLAARLATARPALFLDFDGTLAPIVVDPEAAAAPPGVRAVLARLAARMPVAIVSGRDLPDLEARIGAPGLSLAGGHGFEIRTADGRTFDRGATHVEEVAAAADALDAGLRDVPGVRIERKRRSVAVHTRSVDPAAKATVDERVAAVAAARPRLRLHHGKEVLELQPDLPWDKGRAVLWLLEALGLDGPGVLPIAVGDDRTDEDAFGALSGRGIGVLVATAPRPTVATLRLSDPADVGRFLGWMADRD